MHRKCDGRWEHASHITNIAHKALSDNVFRTSELDKSLNYYLSQVVEAEVINSNISRAQEGNINELRELGVRDILRGEELWKPFVNTRHA